jgi:hypothetical protein
MDEKLYQQMRTDPWGACEAVQSKYSAEELRTGKWQSEWSKACEDYAAEQKRREGGVSPALIADHQAKGIP